jgi:hypothetical protein
MDRSTEVARYNAFVRISVKPPACWQGAVTEAFPNEADAREEVLGLLADSAESGDIQLVPGSVRYAAGTCLALLLRLRHIVS